MHTWPSCLKLLHLLLLDYKTYLHTWPSIKRKRRPHHPKSILITTWKGGMQAPFNCKPNQQITSLKPF